MPLTLCVTSRPAGARSLFTAMLLCQGRHRRHVEIRLRLDGWGERGCGRVPHHPRGRRYPRSCEMGVRKRRRPQGRTGVGLTGALDVGGLVVSRNRVIARSGDVDWVDPLVGFRIRQGLAPGQELLLRANVGGFDVGSQFSWNVLGAYSFAFAVRKGVIYSGLLGYRALSVDFEKGSGTSRYEYDVVQHRPVVGLTIGFSRASVLARRGAACKSAAHARSTQCAAVGPEPSASKGSGRTHAWGSAGSWTKMDFALPASAAWQQRHIAVSKSAPTMELVGERRTLR
jgi:hypothetical protein